MFLQRARSKTRRQSDWSLLVCQGVPRPAQIDFYRRSGASIDDSAAAEAALETPGPARANRRFRGRRSNSPTSWDGIRALFGRSASRRSAPRPRRRTTPDAIEQNNPHLREHLTHGVNRRPDLAQHLQDAGRIVPPFQRVLELPEVKHDVAQIVGRRLLAWSTS
jgi:hypothetical protein